MRRWMGLTGCVHECHDAQVVDVSVVGGDLVRHVLFHASVGVGDGGGVLLFMQHQVSGADESESEERLADECLCDFGDVP